MAEYRELKTIEERAAYILNIPDYKEKGYGPALAVYQEAIDRIEKLEKRTRVHGVYT